MLLSVSAKDGGRESSSETYSDKYMVHGVGGGANGSWSVSICSRLNPHGMLFGLYNCCLGSSSTSSVKSTDTGDPTRGIR